VRGPTRLSRSGQVTLHQKFSYHSSGQESRERGRRPIDSRRVDHVIDDDVGLQRREKFQRSARSVLEVDHDVPTEGRDALDDPVVVGVGSGSTSGERN